MKDIQDLMAAVTAQLEKLARGNAVVAKPISVGERHVVALCELALGFGGAGGVGEGKPDGAPEGAMGSGVGGGAGGGAKAAPVAVLVIENGKVRIESLDR